MTTEEIITRLDFGIKLCILVVLIFGLYELEAISTSTHDSKIELEKIRMGMR